MSKYYICEIDTELGIKASDLDKAMKKIVDHIIKNIDPTFPEKKFKKWLHSGEEKPFRWNCNRYYWDKQ